MALGVIKLDPTDDYFVVWSTVTDQPCGMGYRPFVADFLIQEGASKASAESALVRADETGSSGIVGMWDDPDMLVMTKKGQRRVPRANLLDYAKAVLVDGKSGMKHTEEL